MKKILLFAGPNSPCLERLSELYEESQDDAIAQLTNLVQQGAELPPLTLIVNGQFVLAYVYVGTAFNNGGAFSQNAEFLSTVLAGFDMSAAAYQTDDWETREDFLCAAIYDARSKTNFKP